MRRSVLAIGLLLGLSGCVVATPVASYPAAVSYPPVPAPRAEYIPPAPGGGSAWIAGHWRWNGARYAWIPGQYVVRPAAYTRWVPAHWANRGGAWVWVRGHWA